MVNSILDLLLPQSEQEQRKELVDEVRRAVSRAQVSSAFTRADLDRLKAEIERLEANVMEIQSMALISGQDKVYLKSGLLVGVVPGEEDPTITALHEKLQPSMSDITAGSLSAAVSVATITSTRFLDSTQVADVDLPWLIYGSIAMEHLPLYALDPAQGIKYSAIQAGLLGVHLATQSSAFVTLAPFNVYLKSSFYSTYQIYKTARSRAKPAVWQLSLKYT